MNLREYFKEKIYDKLFIISLLILALSVVVSSLIYLRKLSVSMDESIKTLKEAVVRINRTEELQRQIQGLSFLNPQKDAYAVARLLDLLNSNYSAVKFEVSTPKREGNLVSYELNIKGEESFSTFSNLINTLQTQKYPILFIKFIKINKKENTLDFEIKGEIKLIEHERQNKA